MGLCGLFGHKYRGLHCERCGALTKDVSVLRDTVAHGPYYDALQCARQLLSLGDTGFADLVMKRGFLYGEMAVAVSTVPGEEILRELVLAISSDALLDPNVPLGQMKFGMRELNGIFKNLLRNHPEQATAYLHAFGEYRFFVMKDGKLRTEAGKRSFRNGYLDHQSDRVASCAREALKGIPPERVSAAVDSLNRLTR